MPLSLELEEEERQKSTRILREKIHIITLMVVMIENIILTLERVFLEMRNTRVETNMVRAF